MLLKILGWVPLLQCLTYFSREAHKVALKKFTALWVLTSLPVIFAVVLSPIPNGDTDVIVKLFNKLREAISVSELFVYTASFLTPILYMIFEKYREISKVQVSVRLARSVEGMFTGYGIVALLSLLTMIFTAVAFSLIKTDAGIFKQSFLSHYLTNLSFPIYLFALYCWYLTLLDGVWSGNFVDASRRSENLVSSEFSARLRSRETGDE